jgi:hypothetical protein
MNEAVQAVASTTANATAVSAGLKWGAVLSGLGLLVLLGLAIVIIAPRGNRNPWKLVEGADGSSSTSKFQWFLWLIVILFGYAALWVLRAEQGIFSALSEIPVNLLTVLGFSTATAAAAKGITSGYVQTGRVAKTTATQKAAAQTAAGRTAVAPAAAGQATISTGGILQDDTGVPELAKIQMVGFTLIAAGIFLITVIHQIVSNDVIAGLPNIDSSLMVLMGISQGGYLGKKLVTFGTPALYPPSPLAGPPGTTVTLAGANLGSQSGSQLLLNGSPIEVTDWSATVINFTVPGYDPANGERWAGLPKVVPLVVSAMGQMSNSVNFTVTPPPFTPPAAAASTEAAAQIEAAAESKPPQAEQATEEQATEGQIPAEHATRAQIPAQQAKGAQALNAGSAASSARGSGPSNIVKDEKGPVGADAKEAAGVTPRRQRAGLAKYRRWQWGISVSLALFLGGAIYLLVRQSYYPEASAGEWFAGDAVALGLIAVVATFAAVVFAYPAFNDWRTDLHGPKATMVVRYLTASGLTFDDLPLEAELRQISGPNIIYPTLQFAVNNPSNVPLRDGRLSIYVQPADAGNNVPSVTPQPKNGKVSKFENISHAYWREEPELPASLLLAECSCPPGGISYLEERFEFRETEVYLRIVLEGSNLKDPWTGRYKVRVTSNPR